MATLVVDPSLTVVSSRSHTTLADSRDYSRWPFRPRPTFSLSRCHRQPITGIHSQTRLPRFHRNQGSLSDWF
ncbi:hypothetical protein Q3G72_011569 [Acer saccharum]|nr:hypothetical protein Q3G72_011569 [Acer saccharum]